MTTQEVTPGGDPGDVVDGPYDPEKHGALHPQSMDHPHPDKKAAKSETKPREELKPVNK